MLQAQHFGDISQNDHRLIEEAIRRVRAATQCETAPEALFGTLADHVRRGRRDLFTLVRAGRRFVDGY